MDMQSIIYAYTHTHTDTRYAFLRDCCVCAKQKKNAKKNSSNISTHIFNGDLVFIKQNYTHLYIAILIPKLQKHTHTQPHTIDGNSCTFFDPSGLQY